MEYVASRTLAQVIGQDGPLSPEATLEIGVQIAEALEATHAAGTIHRDVKPGNILVTAEGVAKISDFGIARAHDQSQLTGSGQVIGTPMYFAPELARGEKPTPAADVWALGASLYAAVEGHPPYETQPNALALLATIASTHRPSRVAPAFSASRSRGCSIPTRVLAGLWRTPRTNSSGCAEVVPTRPDTSPPRS